MTEAPPSIAVVGSVNLDLVARVERFPHPGETLTGATVQRHGGGKGANQALAARRLGARVHLVACLGSDPAAREALATLDAEGVDLSACRYLDDEVTGLALILVTDDGENQIVVAPGANAAFDDARLELPSVEAVIAQLEVPMSTVTAAARRHDGFFCLNAAPVKPVAAEVLRRTDLLVVNEIYYPAGWNAYIDGEQAPIHRADYLLRAVPVPAGAHELVMRFEPATYTTSLWLSGVTTLFVYGGVLALLGLAWFRRRDRREEAPGEAS